MRQVVDYDPVIRILAKHLLADEQFSTWGGWLTDEDTGEPMPLIVPRYLNTTDDSAYPILTIYRDYGIRLKNMTGHQEVHYFIHGWLKQSTEEGFEQDVAADCAYLMNMVVDILSDSPYYGRKVKELDMCRLVDSRCPCYQAETRTHFFMTDWKIKVSPSIYYTKEA